MISHLDLQPPSYAPCMVATPNDPPPLLAAKIIPVLPELTVP